MGKPRSRSHRYNLENPFSKFFDVFETKEEPVINPGHFQFGSSVAIQKELIALMSEAFNSSQALKPSRAKFASKIHSTLTYMRVMQDTFPASLEVYNSRFADIQAVGEQPPSEAAGLPLNAVKNFDGTICYDHSRVTLKIDFDTETDYINANYVDGFDHPKKYIMTQLPFQHTCYDFWRMIWQENSRLIVQMGVLKKRQKHDVAKYLPKHTNEKLKFGRFSIQYISTEIKHGANLVTLEVSNTDTMEKRTIYHFHYLKITEQGVPHTVYSFLNFMIRCRIHQTKGLAALDSQERLLTPPIVVCCENGWEFSGLYVVLDILMHMLDETRRINVDSVVRLVRYDRANALSNFNQYLFAQHSVLEYAKMRAFCNTKLTVCDK